MIRGKCDKEIYFYKTTEIGLIIVKEITVRRTSNSIRHNEREEERKEKKGIEF